MPGSDDRDDYVTRYGNFNNESGDGTTSGDTDLITLEVDHRTQVTHLDIQGAAANLYALNVRDQDGTNESTVKTFYGSDVGKGDFQDPVVTDVGAAREVVVTNLTQLSDDNFSVNLEIDELDPTS